MRGPSKITHLALSENKCEKVVKTIPKRSQNGVPKLSKKVVRKMIDFWIDFGGQNAPKWIPRSAQDASLGDQNGWKTIYWAILCQQQRCELEPNWTKIDIATILLGQSGFQGDQNGSKRIYSSILCQSGAQSDEKWRQNGARLKQNRYRNYLLGEIWCPRRPNWIKNDIRMISNPITCSEMFFHDFKDQTRREKWPNVYIYICMLRQGLV